MPRQEDPNSRPGILRAMEIGDEHTETKVVETAKQVVATRKALANAWAGATSRVTTADFATETCAVVTGDGRIRCYITITRTV